MHAVTQDEPSLLLIDGLNIVRRVYEANPAPDSVDKAQVALRNALSSFRNALRKHRPTHVLALFDCAGKTWRHELYPAYHSTRKPMAQELRDGLPAFYADLTRQWGIPTISKEGYEADDLIGTTLTRWLEKPRGPVKVLSNDKDLLYFVSVGAMVMDHFGGDEAPWRDRDFVHAKFGVQPELILDFHALVGDSVDDVPGVDGVGEKTAARWLNEYGSLEGVLENADRIKGKVGENLRKQADLARLCRQLVAMKTDVTLGLTWNMLRIDCGQVLH